MSEELFPLDSICMDSPRLAWMAKHRVKTRRTGNDEEPWIAWMEKHEKAPGEPAAGLYSWGFDETDSLYTLALKYNLKLWNEEGLQ